MNVFDLLKFNQSKSPDQSPSNTQNNASSSRNHSGPKGHESSDLTQSSPIANIFRNNQMLKQDILVSHFYQAITGLEKHQIPDIKISPTLLINKIQQSHPHYKNSVVYKQLAFDILLETEKTYKVKNCVSPARPNSEVYKRLTKSFFENLKNGIDQCVLFTGMEAGARVQSSIGNQSNPGLFMIIAIAVLDQKYKDHHERFDVEFSFLEYRGQKMYDLINFTEVPLEPKMRDNSLNNQSSNNVEFCEHRVKVCTFLQFIKLFKIALFNNKERDIKTNKNTSLNNLKNLQNSQQFTSSFIMKIRIKKYTAEGQLSYEQQTMLMDLDENSSLRVNSQKSEQSFQENMKQLHQTNKKSSDTGNRSLMDYILIEINNSNPFNKPVHYHMVEKNLLLEVLKKYLRQKDHKGQIYNNSKVQNYGKNSKNNIQKNIVAPFLAKQQAKQHYVGGQLFIINSFTTNPFKYQQNIEFFENLTSALGNGWQACAKPKNVMSKYFDISYSDKTLQKVVQALKNRKYSSLRDLYAAKQFYLKQTKKIVSDLKLNKNLILEYFDQKKSLIYNQNVFTGYQFQLIGNCIKSDNFKDFYTSKSFLALPRQIQIKTQKIKGQIMNGIQNLKQVQEKFNLLKKKQNENKRSIGESIPECLKKVQIFSKQAKKTFNPFKLGNTRASTTKFKLLERAQTSPDYEDYDDLEQFNLLKKYIYDYFCQIWYKAYLTEERTVTDQLIYEEHFASQMKSLKERFTNFIKIVEQIEDVTIKSVDQEKLMDLQNLTQLVRSINQAKKSILNHEPKHPGRSPFAMSKRIQSSKKQNVYRTTNHLPKIQDDLKNKREKSKSTKSINQKDLKRKIQVFQIKAKIDFGSLILNPKRLN